MPQDGDTRASTAMADAVNSALIPVTALGVSRAWKASAARTRPSLRLTNREYAGAPCAPFWAADSRRRVAPRPCGVVCDPRTLVVVMSLPRVDAAPYGGPAVLFPPLLR